MAYLRGSGDLSYYIYFKTVHHILETRNYIEMVSRYLKSDTINKKEMDYNNRGQRVLLRSISIIRRKIMSSKKIQKVKVYDQVANSQIEIIKSGQLQPV